MQVLLLDGPQVVVGGHDTADHLMKPQRSHWDTRLGYAHRYRQGERRPATAMSKGGKRMQPEAFWLSNTWVPRILIARNDPATWTESIVVCRVKKGWQMRTSDAAHRVAEVEVDCRRGDLELRDQGCLGREEQGLEAEGVVLEVLHLLMRGDDSEAEGFRVI